MRLPRTSQLRKRSWRRKSVSDGEPPAYVPMSEWIDDFDPRSRA